MKNHNTKQAVFTFTELGANLVPNHIVFTVEKLVNDFLDRFEYLFHHPQTTGRPKEYKPGELLGFYIIASIRRVTSCRKMADLLKNNDESLNYILNNKKPANQQFLILKTKRN